MTISSVFANWLTSVLSGIVASGAVVSLIYFLGKEAYKDLLTRNLESFKTRLSQDLEMFKFGLNKDMERHKQELGMEATQR